MTRIASTIAAAFAAVGLLASPGAAEAHGGGLNAEGCHNNRKTGDYHCHRGDASSDDAKKARPSERASFIGSRSGGSYANCTEARAAGASNIRRGEAGYGEHLDRDGDGVACEQ